MKIAVLTFWWGDDNYGQLLQCFALQHYLRNIGHDAYLVRYKPSSKEYLELSHTDFIKDKFKKLVKFLNPYYIFVQRKRIIERNTREHELSKVNHIENKIRDFDKFRKEYLQVSNVLYESIEELRNNPPVADIYICGSDQIWHDSLSLPNMAGWFLQFGSDKIRRVSYAASIGRNIEPFEENTFIRYLNRFDAISLREQTACDYCKSIGYEKSTVVCDPSFLLAADYYKRTLGVSDSQDSKPYVFFYTLNIRSKEEIFADKVIEESSIKGWGVKSVGSSGFYTARNIIPGIDNIPATIPQWIQLISESRLVVTTSFHGIVFSILMHRPFISVPLQGQFAKANDRIIGLLEILGLSDRVAYIESDISAIINSQINWEEVDKKILMYSSLGKNFLNKFV